MEFRRKDRRDHEEANKLKGDFTDLLNTKCSLCKEKPWVFYVGESGSDSFTYLDGLGCPDGFAVVCEDCFQKHFSQYAWRYDSLVY
jgi:hypothetical protein